MGGGRGPEGLGDSEGPRSQYLDCPVRAPQGLLPKMGGGIRGEGIQGTLTVVVLRSWQMGGFSSVQQVQSNNQNLSHF